MQNEPSFKDHVIVACGTLIPELTYLKNSGFLDAKKILYTTPGRHEIPRELEEQLVKQIRVAKKYSQKIIVVYGGKFCYINSDDPYRTIDKVIEEQGPGVSRIKASHCIDMLASVEERDRISKGEKIWWMTPGWIKYRKYVFQDWDKGMAVENFPKHIGGAIVLDGIGFYDRYSEEHPEEILEFSDWMGIPIESREVSLDRLKKLLLEQVK
ncbi:MAG: DUF1638 domain-containing protein [Dehalococcoidia bacterium]|jgi:hypothetical protein|nr:DUF1638 domain-containing protein [Chloroflexota bacterium]MCK4242088.1 DUF1638 domain-containing protein [Dehalococcoidia bacterium]